MTTSSSAQDQFRIAVVAVTPERRYEVTTSEELARLAQVINDTLDLDETIFVFADEVSVEPQNDCHATLVSFTGSAMKILPEATDDDT